MAQLFNIETNDEKRNKILKTLCTLGLIAAIIFMAFVNDRKEAQKVIDATEAELYVHVKGAVEKSGVYSVPFGTRVCDLEEYVGGFLENADVDGVNLAAYVYDGQEIYIPYKGTAQSGAINLNSATREELQLVEGIGETYSRKIITYRESHGGFSSVTELKGVLGISLYEDVRERFYVEK